MNTEITPLTQPSGLYNCRYLLHLQCNVSLTRGPSATAETLVWINNGRSGMYDDVSNKIDKKNFNETSGCTGYHSS